MQAWLKHRVGLKPLKTSDISLNALDRGTTLHRALELLTKRLNTLQAFLSCSDADAINICEEAARGAVDHLDSGVRQRVGSGILRLEEARLKQVLLSWIDFERTRTLGFEVEQQEYKIAWQHNGLELSVTADRIDRLESGDTVIIDYKSSPTPSMAIHGLIPCSVFHSYRHMPLPPNAWPLLVSPHPNARSPNC